MKIFTRVAYLLAALFVANFAHGENGKSQIYFLKESVSIMDFGLFKLKTHLDSIKIEGVDQIVFSTNYDVKNNEIQIKGLGYLTKNLKAEEGGGKVEYLCQEVINSVREYLTINIETGKPIFSSCLQTFFDKSGTDIPLFFFQEMDKITIISVTFYIDKTKYVRCDSPLITN